MVGEEGLEPPHVKTSAIYSRDLAVEDFIKPCLAFACVYLFRHSPKYIKARHPIRNKIYSLIVSKLLLCAFKCMGLEIGFEPMKTLECQTCKFAV